MNVSTSLGLKGAGGLQRMLMFTLPALVLVAIVTVTIVWKQELIVSRTPIYVFTENALGVARGMPVKVFGITVGAVTDIIIIPGSGGAKGRVRVELEVKSEHLQHIPRDSRARLLRESVVGQSIIEILPGEGQERPIARNEVLAFERSKSVGEIAEELNHMIAPAVLQVKEFVETMKMQGGEAQKSLQHAATLLEELPESNRQLRKTLVAAEKVLVHVDGALGEVATKAGSTLDSVQRTADSVQRTAAGVETAMPSVLGKIEKAADSAAQTAVSVKALADGAATRIPVLLDSGSMVVRDVDEIVEGAKRSWPVRNFISGPADLRLPLDSQEAARPIVKDGRR